MYVSLIKLPDEGRRFEYQYGQGEIDLGGCEFAIVDPPRIAGRVDQTGLDVRVRGQLAARITAPCDRCLDDVSFVIDQPFDLFYAPGDFVGEATTETELQLQRRDLDFSVYDGDAIDLDELVREQLALNLPLRVLCKEDCRGLCSQCGVDLNRETCGCQKPLDPRWKPLADLKFERSK
jgi:DUF177 domain-containing protein